MAQEKRIDTISKIDSFEKLTNGFLKVDAYLTRCGVFQYEDQDGNLYNELRHPEDVYEDESIKTLQGLVLTDEHPMEFVNSDNCKKYQVGYSDSWLRHDDGKIGASTTWTERTAIALIESGEKRDMSCGYYCDVIEESGEWMGIPYQKRQKNIRYNHAALTVLGRAGKDVGLRMDSAGQKIKIAFLKKDSCGTKNAELELKQVSKNGVSKMTDQKVKIKVDTAEIEVQQDVAVAFKNLENKVSALGGENEALKSEVTKRDSKILELEKSNSEDEVLKRADALLAIKSFAEKVLKDEKIDGLTIAEMKSKVVAKQTGLDVSKKDSVFIDSAFEAVKALWKDEVKNDKVADALAQAASGEGAQDYKKLYQEKTDGRWKQKLAGGQA